MQAVPADQQQRIAGALVDTLADENTGVGCDAATALQQYGSTDQGVHGMLCCCTLACLWHIGCIN